MRRRRVLLWTVVCVLLAAVFAACGGGNSEGQAPPLDAAEFQQGCDQLGTMIDRAEAGDADGADEAFTRVLPLARTASEALAGVPDEIIARAELIDAVALTKEELAGERRPDVLADLGEDAREALADAAEALEVERLQ